VANAQPEHFQPVRGGDVRTFRLERIPRSGNEVHPVQPQLLSGRLSHAQVPQVEGIKRPSKKRYAPPFANHACTVVDSRALGNAGMRV
jgi:hypothetical protein